MSPSYADNIDKLVKDNYFHWEFNIRMKLARKGLLPQIIKPEFDQVSDRSKAEWKTNDPKALGVIAGDVSHTYQVYVRRALTAAEAWTMLEEHFNKKTLKNLFLVTKKLNNFKMEPGTKFSTNDDKFKEIVLQKETIGETLDQPHQIMLILGSLTDQCKMISTVLEMTKSEWFAHSGASSHMTSVRDKFVSIKELKTPVRITIADGSNIDAVAKGTVGLKLLNGSSVKLSDVLYIPNVEGSLTSTSKLAEKNVVAQFSKDKCVFRYGDATVMEAKRCGNVYKLKTVGDEVWHAAMTSRKEPWAVVHTQLGHIPYKCYEKLLTMTEGVPRITSGVPGDNVCAGCCMGKMKADDFPRHPEKVIKSAGILDPVTPNGIYLYWRDIVTHLSLTAL